MEREIEKKKREIERERERERERDWVGQTQESALSYCNLGPVQHNKRGRGWVGETKHFEKSRARI